MQLKLSGLRYLDIASNFNAVYDFILCGVYIPVFLCGFAVLLCYSGGVWCLYTGISVRFCGVRTPLRPPLLDFCLI